MHFLSSEYASLRSKLIGLLTGVTLVLLAVFSLYTVHDQKSNTETEMVEQCRMLTREMDSVWEFISLNQDVINRDSTGEYSYKGIHCALAGKSVAALFSRDNDYTIGFTRENPRNPANAPDEFELEGLAAFNDNPGLTEYYDEVSDEDGELVFRYMRVMPVKEDCLECHGQPRGEIDATGYEKEGWTLGQVGGATSVTVPTTLYYQNMKSSILSNIFFFAIILLVMVSVIYVGLNRMVTGPLSMLNDYFGDMRNRSNNAINPRNESIKDNIPGIYNTKEIDSIYTGFDQLSQSLETLYSDLDSQVKQRTSELRDANEQLKEQRKQVEDMLVILQEENQYKSDFLAIVSHELRTPLTCILAFADLLEDSIPPENAIAVKQINEILKNGQILLEMVNNVLETARIQAGNEKVNNEIVELSDIVGSVEESMDSLALKKSIMLTTEVDPEVPLILSDWEKLRRILVNLVSNAIKFTPQDGSVSVHVSYDVRTRLVAIEVADTGIGIDPENHDLIFERFTQENMSTSRRYGGSGLGLSLVKDLVTMLGGTIKLKSELGQGAIFTVYLPVKTGIQQ